MSEQDQEIIEEVLKQSSEDIKIENIPDESISPLAHPVIEKGTGIKQGSVSENSKETNDSIEDTAEESVLEEPPLDAPEQEINEDSNSREFEESEQAEFNIPDGHVNQTAEVFIGMADNLFHVTGGFFVKLNKYEEFYDFEDFLEIIDEQNDKNIQKIKLDEDDKVLLRPILRDVIKEKGKVLTPTQRLTAALISIVVKKVQTAVMIRQENEVLEERLLDIIQQQKEASQEDLDEQSEDDHEDVEVDNHDRNKVEAIPDGVVEVAEE